MIDLHIHSTASDGQYTPREIVEIAAQKNLDAIALTDHDTIDGLAEASEAAKEYGVSFIPGIEISVQGLLGVKELHILGYWIDPESEVLQSSCERYRLRRTQRAERIYAYLEEHGVPVTHGSVTSLADGAPVGRPHFARALVSAGYVSTVREAFDRYLDTPAFQKIKRPLSPAREGIAVIRAAGGIPVLAHPIQTKLPHPELEQLVRLLVDDGLRGVECYYSTHTPEDTDAYLSIARRYDLIVTGGSDFHGEKIKPRIAMGSGIDGSLCVTSSPILHMQNSLVTHPLD